MTKKRDHQYHPYARKRYHRRQKAIAKQVVQLCRDLDTSPRHIPKFYKLGWKYRKSVISILNGMTQ